MRWRPSQPGAARARCGAVLVVVAAAAAASLSCGALYRYKVRDLAHDHPDVVYFVDTRAKAVALTLDDGPDAATTPAILDLLKQPGARATSNLRTCPDVPARNKRRVRAAQGPGGSG